MFFMWKEWRNAVRVGQLLRLLQEVDPDTEILFGTYLWDQTDPPQLTIIPLDTNCVALDHNLGMMFVGKTFLDEKEQFLLSQILYYEKRVGLENVH